MTLIIFLIILSFLVLIHEMGHFLVARKAGIKVEEFGFGYPPKAFKFYTDKHGTDYTVNWLPFGGFVRLHGEEQEGTTDTQSTGLFYKKSKLTRLAVITAGAIINFIFGALAFGAIYTKTGIPTELDYVKIEEVAPGSPAEQAGLMVGDAVNSFSIDVNTMPVTDVDQFISTLSDHRGSSVIVNVTRDNKALSLPIYVRTESETPADQGSIGVIISNTEFRHYPLWQMPFRGMWVGLKAALLFGYVLILALGGMIRDLLLSGAVPADVAGPVGIVYTASKEGLLTSGLLDTLNFSAVLSINLAIINLLPFPALDGGRAMFVVIEGIIGRRIKPKLEQWANMIGMLLLLTLIVLVSIRDVRHVAADQSVRDWFQKLIP